MTQFPSKNIIELKPNGLEGYGAGIQARVLVLDLFSIPQEFAAPHCIINNLSTYHKNAIIVTFVNTFDENLSFSVVHHCSAIFRKPIIPHNVAMHNKVIKSGIIDDM